MSRQFFVTSGGIDEVNVIENSKCIKYHVRINTFGKMPEIIASFFTLPIHKECRGDRLLRSSTSSLADSGADFSTVKRHAGWRAKTAAKG
jgi:hypothetical protein